MPMVPYNALLTNVDTVNTTVNNENNGNNVNNPNNVSVGVGRTGVTAIQPLIFRHTRLETFKLIPILLYIIS